MTVSQFLSKDDLKFLIGRKVEMFNNFIPNAPALITGVRDFRGAYVKESLFIVITTEAGEVSLRDLVEVEVRSGRGGDYIHFEERHTDNLTTFSLVREGEPLKPCKITRKGK